MRLPPSLPSLTEEQRQRIQERLSETVDRLRAQDVLPRSVSEETVRFGWPLSAPSVSDPGVHGISSFVDHDPSFPGSLLDYSCGGRTYDLESGYNHQGTDFFLWPFSWLLMDGGEVHVVSVAAGVIIGKDDGNFDRSCSLGGDWNAVYVRNDDGTTAWYGHLKRGSLTTKAVGTRVAEGEFLGRVGSSGSSIGPHLHLEFYEAESLRDAYGGACNAANGNTSYWKSQRSYYDSTINKLAVHHSPPVFPACPGIESPNISNRLSPGQRAHFAVYFRDQRAVDTTRYTISRPNGSVFASWTHSPTVDFYAASYWYWTLTLPTSVPEGIWTFDARHKGLSTTKTFAVGDPPAPPGTGDCPHGTFSISETGKVCTQRAYFCSKNSNCFNTGGGADLAERIDATEPLEPGDLVEIDPQTPGRYRLARGPGTGLAVGVVTSMPAIMLGDRPQGPAADSRPVLALMGRVPVKATTESGPIRVGDLLVSSSVPGAVMRCDRLEDCDGRLVGKALQALEQDGGTIEMLLMR